MKGVSQIVGAVLLIAITVIAAIALYFMINQNQVETNVQFGSVKLEKCLYNSTGGYIVLVLRNTGDDLTGINITLQDKNYEIISYNDTYSSQTLKGGNVITKVKFDFNITKDYTNLITSTGVKNTPYSVEFVGSGKITPIEVKNCQPM